MKDEAAFNVLSILLEIVLFTGMVGTALAVRFRRKNRETPAAAAPVLAAAPATPQAPGPRTVWSGEMTPEELAERRRQMLNVAYTLAVVVISGVVAVSVFFWRHRSS